jgi:hypothetical protein
MREGGIVVYFTLISGAAAEHGAELRATAERERLAALVRSHGRDRRAARR